MIFSLDLLLGVLAKVYQSVVGKEKNDSCALRNDTNKEINRSNYHLLDNNAKRIKFIPNSYLVSCYIFNNDKSSSFYIKEGSSGLSSLNGELWNHASCIVWVL